MEKQSKEPMYTQIKDLVELVIGGDWGTDEDKSTDDDVSVHCIRGSEFKNWDQEKGKSAVLRKISPTSLQKRALIPGDILIEISGGGPEQPVGRTVLIDDAVITNFDTPIVCTNFLRLLRVEKSNNPGFINYFLKYFYSSGQVIRYQGGSNNLRNLKYKEFETVEVPLPSFEEQTRITAKLDQLFNNLQQVKLRLERIPEILKQFKQATLKKAVTGKLTQQWALDNSYTDVMTTLSEIAELKKPARYNSKSSAVLEGKYAISVGHPIIQIPERYRWTELVSIASLETGHTPSRKHMEYWDGNINWIGITDAREYHGKTIPETKQKTTALGLLNSAARLLPKGTVCLSRTASVGYVTVMGQEMATSQDFVNWVCSDAINPHWLKLLLMAEKESIVSFGKGTTHKTIYFPEVISFYVALPPIEEQDEIVRCVESLFDKADAIEGSYKILKERIDQLPQAILAKAMKGELP